MFQILLYFFCKNCNPPSPSPPFPPSPLPKLRLCQAHPLHFWTFSRRVNPPSQKSTIYGKCIFQQALHFKNSQMTFWRQGVTHWSLKYFGFFKKSRFLCCSKKYTFSQVLFKDNLPSLKKTFFPRHL